MTEEQRIKKDLLREKFTDIGLILKRVREKYNLTLGQAIDYVYQHLEQDEPEMDMISIKKGGLND